VGGGAGSPSGVEESFERMAAQFGARFEALMQELRKGGGAEVGCKKALERPLGNLEEKVLAQFKKAAEVEAEVTRLRSEAGESKAALLQCRQELEQGQVSLASEAERVRSFKDKLKDVEAQLAKSISGLEEAANSGGVRFLEKAGPILEKGNVAVNLQTMALDIKKAIEFKARKPTEEPTAAFTNTGAADDVIQDAAEVLKLFPGLPVTVESHVKPGKGGTEQFWEQIATNRADLVSQQMAQKGVEESQLQTKGLSGKKGLNTNAIVVKLTLPGK